MSNEKDLTSAVENGQSFSETEAAQSTDERRKESAVLGQLNMLLYGDDNAAVGLDNVKILYDDEGEPSESIEDDGKIAVMAHPENRASDIDVVSLGEMALGEVVRKLQSNEDGDRGVNFGQDPEGHSGLNGTGSVRSLDKAEALLNEDVNESTESHWEDGLDHLGQVLNEGLKDDSEKSDDIPWGKDYTFGQREIAAENVAAETQMFNDDSRFGKTEENVHSMETNKSYLVRFREALNSREVEGESSDVVQAQTMFGPELGSTLAKSVRDSQPDFMPPLSDMPFEDNVLEAKSAHDFITDMDGSNLAFEFPDLSGADSIMSQGEDKFTDSTMESSLQGLTIKADVPGNTLGMSELQDSVFSKASLLEQIPMEESLEQKSDDSQLEISSIDFLSDGDVVPCSPETFPNSNSKSLMQSSILTEILDLEKTADVSDASNRGYPEVEEFVKNSPWDVSVAVDGDDDDDDELIGESATESVVDSPWEANKHFSTAELLTDVDDQTFNRKFGIAAETSENNFRTFAENSDKNFRIFETDDFDGQALGNKSGLKPLGNIVDDTSQKISGVAFLDDRPINNRQIFTQEPADLYSEVGVSVDAAESMEDQVWSNLHMKEVSVDETEDMSSHGTVTVKGSFENNTSTTDLLGEEMSEAHTIDIFSGKAVTVPSTVEVTSPKLNFNGKEMSDNYSAEVLSSKVTSMPVSVENNPCRSDLSDEASDTPAEAKGELLPDKYAKDTLAIKDGTEGLLEREISIDALRQDSVILGMKVTEDKTSESGLLNESSEGAAFEDGESLTTKRPHERESESDNVQLDIFSGDISFEDVIKRMSLEKSFDEIITAGNQLDIFAEVAAIENAKIKPFDEEERESNVLDIFSEEASFEEVKDKLFDKEVLDGIQPHIFSAETSLEDVKKKSFDEESNMLDIFSDETSVEEVKDKSFYEEMLAGIQPQSFSAISPLEDAKSMSFDENVFERNQSDIFSESNVPDFFSVETLLDEEAPEGIHLHVFSAGTPPENVGSKSFHEESNVPYNFSETTSLNDVNDKLFDEKVLESSQLDLVSEKSSFDMEMLQRNQPDILFEETPFKEVNHKALDEDVFESNGLGIFSGEIPQKDVRKKSFDMEMTEDNNSDTPEDVQSKSFNNEMLESNQMDILSEETSFGDFNKQSSDEDTTQNNEPDIFSQETPLKGEDKSVDMDIFVNDLDNYSRETSPEDVMDKPINEEFIENKQPSLSQINLFEDARAQLSDKETIEGKFSIFSQENLLSDVKMKSLNEEMTEDSSFRDVRGKSFDKEILENSWLDVFSSETPSEYAGRNLIHEDMTECNEPDIFSLEAPDEDVKKNLLHKEISEENELNMFPQLSPLKHVTEAMIVDSKTSMNKERDAFTKKNSFRHVNEKSLDEEILEMGVVLENERGEISSEDDGEMNSSAEIDGGLTEDTQAEGVHAYEKFESLVEKEKYVDKVHETEATEDCNVDDSEESSDEDSKYLADKCFGEVGVEGQTVISKYSEEANYAGSINDDDDESDAQNSSLWATAFGDVSATSEIHLVNRDLKREPGSFADDGNELVTDKLLDDSFWSNSTNEKSDTKIPTMDFSNSDKCHDEFSAVGLKTPEESHFEASVVDMTVMRNHNETSNVETITREGSQIEAAARDVSAEESHNETATTVPVTSEESRTKADGFEIGDRENPWLLVAEPTDLNQITLTTDTFESVAAQSEPDSKHSETHGMDSNPLEFEDAFLAQPEQQSEEISVVSSTLFKFEDDFCAPSEQRWKKEVSAMTSTHLEFEDSFIAQPELHSLEINAIPSVWEQSIQEVDVKASNQLEFEDAFLAWPEQQNEEIDSVANSFLTQREQQNDEVNAFEYEDPFFAKPEKQNGEVNAIALEYEDAFVAEPEKQSVERIAVDSALLDFEDAFLNQPQTPSEKIDSISTTQLGFEDAFLNHPIQENQKIKGMVSELEDTLIDQPEKQSGEANAIDSPLEFQDSFLNQQETLNEEVTAMTSEREDAFFAEAGLHSMPCDLREMVSSEDIASEMWKDDLASSNASLKKQKLSMEENSPYKLPPSDAFGHFDNLEIVMAKPSTSTNKEGSEKSGEDEEEEILSVVSYSIDVNAQSAVKDSYDFTMENYGNVQGHGTEDVNSMIDVLAETGDNLLVGAVLPKIAKSENLDDMPGDKETDDMSKALFGSELTDNLTEVFGSLSEDGTLPENKLPESLQDISSDRNTDSVIDDALLDNELADSLVDAVLEKLVWGKRSNETSEWSVVPENIASNTSRDLPSEHADNFHDISSVYDTYENMTGNIPFASGVGYLGSEEAICDSLADIPADKSIFVSMPDEALFETDDHSEEISSDQKPYDIYSQSSLADQQSWHDSSDTKTPDKLMETFETLSDVVSSNTGMSENLDTSFGNDGEQNDDSLRANAGNGENILSGHDVFSALLKDQKLEIETNASESDGKFLFGETSEFLSDGVFSGDKKSKAICESVDDSQKERVWDAYSEGNILDNNCIAIFSEDLDKNSVFSDVQDSSEGILSLKAGESKALKRELREKGEHGVCDTTASICAEESSLAEEVSLSEEGIEGLALGEQEHLQDVQKEFYSVGGNKMSPDSLTEIDVQFGTRHIAAEMVSLTSDRNDMEEEIQLQENFTFPADNDVLSDSTLTPDVLSPIYKSVSVSQNSSTFGSEPINFGSEAADLNHSLADLQLKPTDLRRSSVAHESASVDSLPESSDQISESFGLKSEAIEPIQESFAFDYNSAFSKPESVITTLETTDTIRSKSESINLLPELVDSTLESESLALSSKSVNVDLGSTTVEFEPESSSSNSDSASPKQEFIKGREQTSHDSAMDAGVGSFSPVLQNRGCADGVDVRLNSTNSAMSQPVNQTELVLGDSWIKHTPESREVLTGFTIDSSQPQTVEMVDETEHIETPSLSASTLLLPRAILKQFCHYSKDDLIRMVLDQQRQLREKDAHIHDLEIYIDNLLAKVLDVQPRILGETFAQGGVTSGPQSPSESARKSSLPSHPENVQTPKATETSVAYQKVTKETADPVQITMVTSPKPAATRKPGFLNVLKVKK